MPPTRPSRFPVLMLSLLIAGYLGAALFGYPQRGTRLINAPLATEHRDPQAPPVPPGYLTVIPFVLLLGAIALFPLIPGTAHWWESNLHRFFVAAGLGVLTLGYYAFVHAHPVEQHFLGHRLVEPSSGGISFGVPSAIFSNAIFQEYIPFIVLLFSLYVISGGIRIQGDLPAHPLTNTTFIGVGAVLANIIGTTGAAMLLIRPLLETNSERRHVRHTVVFFIFAVCNCGGCLLPIGDPPLFLGYLQGVSFLWTLTLWRPWLLVNGALLAIYYVWDHFWCYRREAKTDLVIDETRTSRLQFRGIGLNVPLLLSVVAAVALLEPSQPFLGTTWHPWLYLREIVLLLLVVLSLALGNDDIRRVNDFNYAAIIEVAALFFGIFLCMQPALQILSVNGRELGIDAPWKFFWSTGLLSSFLDNAPTYLVFFKSAQSLHAGGADAVAGINSDSLAAISLGAVFLGAMTYIGNGPNFMVKAIAEKAGVKMPSFFGYMGYSVLVLIPLFVAVTILFFR